MDEWIRDVNFVAYYYNLSLDFVSVNTTSIYSHYLTQTLQIKTKRKNKSHLYING